MDLLEIIRQLYEERKRLDRAIQALESMQETGQPIARKRRGRKSMSREERQRVSERMRRYWAARRSKG